MGSPVIVLAMDTDSPSTARVGRRAWASMVTHMLELLDTPSDWRRAQSVSSMVTHRAASPLPVCYAPSLPDPDPDPDPEHSPPPSPLPCVSPCVPSPSSVCPSLPSLA